MKRSWLAIFAVLILGLAATNSHAQTGTLPVGPEAVQTQPKTNVGNAPAAIGGAVALPEYLTEVHGYQGLLAETLDGKTIASQAVDEKFNPASSVKLATALAALKNFGPDHRFLTTIWTSGTLDRATGTLNGDLVITGRDPSFNYEHAVMFARQLNELGIKSVTGNLIVAPGFTMNFDWSARNSGEDFLETIDATYRPASATRAWMNERNLLGDKVSLSSVPSVTVAGEVIVGPAPFGAKPLVTRKSSKLVDILKVLLCYSNNFMAERIGETLGGPQSVRTLLIDSLKLNPDEIYLATASGLGVNRVTPRAMMSILRGLTAELRKHKLNLTDILPVAGIDPGTLEERFTNPFERGSVVGKTGTLIRTDGGASSLVGQMNTKSGRVIYFVIFNQQGSVIRFRENQDALVTAIQSALGGPAPFAYRPITLPMRLANSDYEAAKARGEFEPREQ
ncbi:MAG TPA: D-alanyl-D-alanine carboxypeptidase [Pyrinomonadaceae bacterium]|nr:D-alanyl-D-alanine carboxypeptidase [Pyrinomonadaceae bacterium]